MKPWIIFINLSLIHISYAMLNIVNEGWFDESAMTYCGAVANISEANYTRDFIARAYVTITYTDNTSVTVYSGMSQTRRDVYKRQAQDIADEKEQAAKEEAAKKAAAAKAEAAKKAAAAKAEAEKKAKAKPARATVKSMKNVKGRKVSLTIKKIKDAKDVYKRQV